MTWPKQKSLKQQVQAKVQRLRPIHQKRELPPAKQDLQGQCRKALQRAGKESHHYPEPSLTRRGRDILEQNMGEQRDP